MLERGSIEWWQDVLERYESVRGQVTQHDFCEREGISHNAFVYRMFGNWPHRRERPAAVSDGWAGDVGAMVPVRVREATPVAVQPPAWVEAEAPCGVVLRFAPGTDGEYLASLLLKLAQGVHRGGDRAVPC